MRALNKRTGQLEKVYVKALDSMPVGTIVSFDGQASDIPVGWEEVSGKNYVAYELFNNNSGISDNITLNDSVENYDYIIVFYSNNSAGTYNTNRIDNPNNKNTTFMTIDIGGGYITYVGGTYKILNNKITHLYSGAFNVRASGITDYSTASVAGNIKIYKVIGYKEV